MERPRLVAVWLAVAAVFGVLLAVAEATDTRLDDPDPARQRPGFLDAGRLPQPAPPLTSGLPAVGRRTVAFFVRPDTLADLCQAVARGDLRGRFGVVIVVSGAGDCDAVTTVGDPKAQLARAYGLARPRGGGPPVGYAVVDLHGQIRYRTLDPTVSDELDEVETILRATP